MHSINTHLHFDCSGDNWRFRFLVNPSNPRGGGGEESFANVAVVGANFLRFARTWWRGWKFRADVIGQEKRILLASDLRHDFVRSRSFWIRPLNFIIRGGDQLRVSSSRGNRSRDWARSFVMYKHVMLFVLLITTLEGGSRKDWMKH